MRGRFQVTTPLRASSISASLPLGQRRADAAPHPNPLPVKDGEREPRRDLLTRVPSPTTPLHPPPSSRRRPGPTTRLTRRHESESRSPPDTSSSSRTRAETCVDPRLRGDDVLRRTATASSDRSQVKRKRSRVSASRATSHNAAVDRPRSPILHGRARPCHPGAAHSTFHPELLDGRLKGGHGEREGVYVPIEII